MPARRVATSRRDPKPDARTKKATVGLRGTLEQLDDRITPAVFTALDPNSASGVVGGNNGPAVLDLLSIFAKAAADGEPDTINLVPFRTYTFSTAAETLADGSNAIPSLVADGPGRNGITINGQGSTFAYTNTATGAPYRFFRVNGSEATTYLTINDLTLNGGVAAPPVGSTATFNGGAVLATGGAAVTLNNSSVVNSQANGNGGGVYVANGSGATFNNVTLNGNTAGVDGGGIYNAGAGFVQFNNSRITGNRAIAGLGTGGASGASGAGGSFEFNDSTLSTNMGKTGGAFSGTNAVFNRDTITGNTATTSGTGGVSSGTASIRVVGSYVAGNQGQATVPTATGGGGVQGANVTVISSTIDNNSSASAVGNSAGGVSGTNVTIQNSTISGNSTAGLAAGGVRATSLNMSGSIVSGNTNNGLNQNLKELQVTGATNSTSGGFNLITELDGTLSKFNTLTSDQTSFDTDQTKIIDPLLGPAQANGGPVLTRGLLAGSPAKDRGPFTAALTTDGRGFNRVVDGRSDVGAFEVQTGNSVGLLAGDDQTAQTNQPFGINLKVRVSDKYGNSVPSVIARFQAPTSPTPTASAIFSGQAAVTGILTDSKGEASVPISANSQVGDYVVNVNTGNGPTGATFNLRNTGFGNVTPMSGSQISIFGSPTQSTTAKALFAQNLVVQVLDASGNPLNNVPVTLTALTAPNGASLTFTGDATTITVNTATLTVNGLPVMGLVSVPVTANQIASSIPYSVEATGPNVGTVSFSLTNLPAAASNVTVLSGADQATQTNTPFASFLKAQVTDIFGNPVLANVSVTFSGPSSMQGATFAGSTSTTVNTDANGIAQALPTANAVGGEYYVDANVPGSTQPPAQFHLNNIFVPPSPPPPPPPPNTAPTITDVPNQTIVNGASGTFSFGVFDAESAADALVVTATTSNAALTSFTLGGSGVNRTITVNTASGQLGTATITLTVKDEQGATKTDMFDVTLAPQPTSPPPSGGGGGTTNTPPVISPVDNQTITAGQSVSVPFVVVDAETADTALTTTVTAANPTLFSALSITGTGSNRSVNLTSASGQSGSTTITLTVTDADNNQRSSIFTVTVPATNPPPPPPTPTVPLVGSPQFAVGSGPGGSQVIRYFNADRSERFLVPAFPGLTGGVRTATGDFNNDGVADVVIGTGPGSATQVQVLDGTSGAVLFQIQPFESSFTGGVYVAAGDLTGDGIADLVITPDEGGGPRARILNGNGFGVIADFFVIDDPSFRGGARAALGDVNGDGRDDLIASAGFGGGPRIAGYDGKSLGGTPQKLFADFFLFENTLRNGAFIAVGDINGDGFADIVGGGGPGGGPRVFALSGQSLLTNTVNPIANFFTGDTNDRGGVRVAIKNLDGDTKADIIVGSGDGSGNRVVGYLGSGINTATVPVATFNLDTFPGFTGGVFVG